MNSNEQAAAVVRELARTPARLYGDLFVDVQMQRLFDDGKTFADAAPRALAPAALRALYEARRGEPGFSLAAFVAEHFELPPAPPEAPPTTQPNLTPGPVRAALLRHIEALWPQLVRHPRPPAAAPRADTLIDLSRPYVVPGGRFREIYYWDSYFTMLGLIENGQRQLALDMLANFADLIDRYGHVPNGNRSYFVSRSQPPFFYKMVELLAGAAPALLAAHLPQLEREYAYWMDGAAALAPGSAHRHVLRLADGALLNRYWDDLDTPREESFREDRRTAEQAPERPPQSVWRDLRAGAESGWDFSSRWCADPQRLETIETTALAPIDLNSLMAGLEGAIAAARRAVGDAAGAADFEARAARRRAAIDAHLWREDLGHYVDLHWPSGQPRDRLSAAALVPLWLGLASPQQAAATARSVRGPLLARYGLLSTPLHTVQQWDAPNGWAPLQWMAVEGLRRYGEHEFARAIATRWMGVVEHGYARSGKLLEKYDVVDDRAGGGGEYPTQDGFGWTNACYVALARLYPESEAP
ncbi:MAG: alpha,alpha-trehalase TreF [Burkholderiales bacterium]|nr:alpha,alpha-trehalase TreF [Burkholderiales bacterium]MDE1927929.1 alpha,alpha-trehalase TreF [Burkholderiales bacterium]MDE2158039.1 alpha,alpha-trehalase TreF [Burkholderiales bacterium]MDE2504203.1 alpha,alpha-trehalase TreF [Burkholderiales bacterium]